MRGTRSMRPSSRPNSGGGRARISTPASKRRCSGTSTMSGGGNRCASATQGTASAFSARLGPERQPMRIVVTGREGQIVRSLIERGPLAGHDVVPLGRPELDLAQEPASIVDVIKAGSPDVIVSSAAYTAVDRAESEPDLAFAINERGAGAVAQAAAELGVPLIHI